MHVLTALRFRPFSIFVSARRAYVRCGLCILRCELGTWRLFETLWAPTTTLFFGRREPSRRRQSICLNASRTMLYRALLLALATAHAWNECAFPDVGYYAVDEGLGLSFAYGASAMNGNLYTGGYYKGHYAVVGVTDSGEVAPEPSATLWGDVTSDVQVRMAQTSEPSRPPRPGALALSPRFPIDRTSTLRRRTPPGR